MAGELYPTPPAFGSPAGAHEEGHRANGKRFSDIAGGIYHWVRKRLPTPGAQNYAFETLGLTEFTPIGPAVAQRHMFAVLQPPALYVGGQAVLTNGLGGLAAGQIIFQPLYDPSTNSYAGSPL